MSLRAAGFIIFRVVSQEVEYLLMKAAPPLNHWTPPKGHTDPGEDDMQTALRETEEEAGLTASHLTVVQDFRRELNYIAHRKPKVVIYWLAKLLDPQTTVKLSHEHVEYKWVKLEEACQLAGYEDLQGVLRDCDAYLKNNKNLI